MAKTVLFDDPTIRIQLYPLTFLRAIADLRIGILTLREKWENYLNQTVQVVTDTYLQKCYPLQTEVDCIYINASVLPNENLSKEILLLQQNESLVLDSTLIAYRGSKNTVRIYKGEIKQVLRPWDIYSLNREELIKDFKFITLNRTSAKITDPYTRVYAPENIFIEEGARIYNATLNAENGPIYIGKNAEIQDGSIIRGSFAMLDNAVLNLGAKMRGDSTIGPNCKVGGEVSNTVFIGNSNKAHDGYMGNSVIGEWCNFGADSNTSNLKNNFSDIKSYSYSEQSMVDTQKRFMGSIIGDHCKFGINSMLGAGTVFGIMCNFVSNELAQKHAPSFSWIQNQSIERYDFNKGIETSNIIMGIKKKSLSAEEVEVLNYIYKNFGY